MASALRNQNVIFNLVDCSALLIHSIFIGTGGLANSKPPAPPVVSGLQRDTSQVTTLTELGKKLLEAAKVGDTSQVRRLMAIGAPFASDGVCIEMLFHFEILLWVLKFLCDS